MALFFMSCLLWGLVLLVGLSLFVLVGGIAIWKSGKKAIGGFLSSIRMAMLLPGWNTGCQMVIAKIRQSMVLMPFG
jgi:hypothetical protein